MALSPGTFLGAYEILAPLASGGMGEVFRARDPKLNRAIAIKILPETTAADPERRARFEREAQTIAALNHPNIVTIHSVEAASGVLFLTMELVEGKPLSDLIVKAACLWGTYWRSRSHWPMPSVWRTRKGSHIGIA